MKRLPPHVVHGSSTAYCNYSCRCEECRNWNRVAFKRRVLRRMEEGPLLVPAVGVCRRIQALQYMGWTLRHIAEAAGYGSPVSVGILLTDRETVHVDTVTRIDRAFRKLGMTRGPSTRTAAIARNKGYAPPLAWNNIDNPLDEPQGVLECSK